MAKVLFVGPDLNEVGGVSFYCSAILAGYPGEIEYFSFPINMRNKPLLFVSVLMTFGRTLLKNSNMIVHLNTSLNTNAIIRDSLFLLISILLKNKVVVFIHGWEESFARSLFGFRRFFFKLFFDRADVLIVLAEQFKHALQNLGLNTKFVVETTCYPPDLQRSTPFSIPMFWESCSGPNVLFLSRIVKEKGIFELFEACLLLRAEFPSLSLYVAGDGPDLLDFRNYVEARDGGFVVFCGSVSGKIKNNFFDTAHLFCLPTYYGEGLPVTILEALFFGLPVITTKVGGIAGILSDGVHGFFVKPGDVNDLAEKIRTVLCDRNLFERISKDNAEYAKRFSPEIVASRLALLHNELIHHRGN